MPAEAEADARGVSGEEGDGDRDEAPPLSRSASLFNECAVDAAPSLRCRITGRVGSSSNASDNKIKAIIIQIHYVK